MAGGSSPMRTRGGRPRSPGPASPPHVSNGAGLTTPSRTVIAAICAALVLATLAVYAQTLRYGYVFYDDDLYVYNNPRVQGGLTARSFAWAWTTFDVANWHPLTWLSYLIDNQ